MVWSDESRFCVCGNDGTPSVLTKQGKKYVSCYVLLCSSVNFDGGSLMVRYCFWTGGLDLSYLLTEKWIKSPILLYCRNTTFPGFKTYIHQHEDRSFMLQEDNVSYHTGAYAKWWKRPHSMNVMEDWPLQSPDLNPIEYIWSELAHKLGSQKRIINNTKDLWRKLLATWQNIDVEFATKLIESVARKCQAVIDTKGEVTKY